MSQNLIVTLIGISPVTTDGEYPSRAYFPLADILWRQYIHLNFCFAGFIFSYVLKCLHRFDYGKKRVQKNYIAW